MKFDTPADHQPDRPAQGRRQADRPHRRPAQDHRHRALRLRAARRRAEPGLWLRGRRRRSPRAGSPSIDTRRGQGRARRARDRDRARTPASSARAECNTAKLLGGPEIEHYHQAIALVVAETFEQARAAAQLVRVDYARRDGRVRPRGAKRRAPASAEQRRAAARRTRARRRLRRRLRRGAGASSTRPTPRPTRRHAMMEPHATIAAWDGDKLTLWTSNQMIAWGTGDLAKTLGIPKENVRLISPYHRRRLRRQAVPARRRAAGRARRARGRAAGEGGAARGR